MSRFSAQKPTFSRPLLELCLQNVDVAGERG